MPVGLLRKTKKIKSPGVTGEFVSAYCFSTIIRLILLGEQNPSMLLLFVPL